MSTERQSVCESEMELQDTRTRNEESDFGNHSGANSVLTDALPSISYPAVDTSWEAWRFVLSSFTIDTFTWGSIFSWGTWQAHYSTASPFQTNSSVQLSAIGTTAIALAYGEMLVGILACRRWPHLVQRGVWISLAVYLLAQVIASFSQNVATLIVFQGILAGAAGGLVYAPIYVYLSEWFVEKRSLAGGTIFSGAGVGGFVFPLILNTLLPRVGFRWTLRIFALINAVFCGAAIFGLKPRIPPQKPVAGASRQTPILWRNFIRDPSFLLLTATTFTQGFFYNPITVYLPSYAKSFVSPLSANFTLSVLNAASVLGQIGTGYLCDHFKYSYVMLASALVSSCAVFGLLRVSDNLAKIMGFSALIGVTGGGFSSTWFPSCVDVAGKSTQQAGPIFGWFSLVRGVAAVVGPMCAGFLYDPRFPVDVGGWKTWGEFGLGKFVVFCGSLGIATAIGSLMVEGVRRTRQRN